MHASPLDPSAVAEAVAIFKRLLRFDTTNPPGNEAPAVAFVAETLRAAGCEPVVLESAPGRANLVARLAGGPEAPLLLTGHVDVVPVERARWTADPFGAEEREGWIYGRGAVDMKHHVAMCLAVFLAAARRKVRLRRDLVLAVVADEEMGSTYGMRWLCREHPALVEAGYALNEFGGFPLYLPGGRRAFVVQVAERGFAWLRLRARGEPGHGSLPPEASAVARLAEAVRRLAETRLPRRVTPEARRFLADLARAMGPAGLLPKLLTAPLVEPLALRLFPDGEQARVMVATLHNTAVPTMLRAGEKTNVLPGVAEAQVDGRYLPGCTEGAFLDEVRAVVGPEIEVEVTAGGPPGSSPVDTDLYRTIEGVVKERADAPVVPNIAPGFTDSKWLQDRGVVCYGFSPLLMPPEVRFSRLVHGHDERLPRAGFEWGVETLWQTVSRFCAA